MTDEGVKATCLLNPMLNLNSLVHIDKSFVRGRKVSRGSQVKQADLDGIYRIIKVTHEGDTRGNAWYTEFTGISQSGTTPNIEGGLR